MSDELLRLADRIEAASGPSRELDASIAWATGRFDRFKIGMGDYMTVALQGVNNAGMAEVHVISPSGGRISYSDDPPHYSGSLDAAMTLVPKGWNWGASLRAHQDDAQAWAENGKSAFVGTGFRPNPERQWFDTVAATPALALCAASLRARASRLRMEVE